MEVAGVVVATVPALVGPRSASAIAVPEGLDTGDGRGLPPPFVPETGLRPLRGVPALVPVPRAPPPLRAGLAHRVCVRVPR